MAINTLSGQLIQGVPNVETITGAKTLVNTNVPIQRINNGGGGALVVNLPAVEAGLWFFIINSTGAARALTVTAATLTGGSESVAQNQCAFFACDGTNWRSLGVITYTV